MGLKTKLVVNDDISFSVRMKSSGDVMHRSVESDPNVQNCNDVEFSGLSLVGGADLSFPNDGKGDTAIASFVIMTFPELKVNSCRKSFLPLLKQDCLLPL